MRIGMQDSRVFDGSPVDIVRAMQALAWGVEKLPLPEYIRWIAANALKFHEVELSVQVATDEEMAASLIGELIRTGLSWSI